MIKHAGGALSLTANKRCRIVMVSPTLPDGFTGDLVIIISFFGKKK